MLAVLVIIPRKQKQKFRSFSYLTQLQLLEQHGTHCHTGQLARDWESMWSR
jgi:hypothetical protein